MFAGSIEALATAVHSRLDRRVLWGVFALALAVHAVNLGNQFAWDDGYLIVNNESIHSLSRAGEWFTKPWSAGAGAALRRTQNMHFWRPIAEASYAIDWALSGGAPWLFHATNDLLHALAAALVAWLTFALVVRTRGDDDPRITDATTAPPGATAAALAAGVLFAVHPVHSEAVNLACYRTTLLASAAVLGGLALHVRGGRWAPWTVPLVLALGVMSKESAIVLPALAFVYDLALGRLRPYGWHLVRRYAGLILVAVAFVIAHTALTSPSHFDYLRGASPLDKVLTMLSVVTLYARLLVVPYPLTPFYDWSLVPIRTSVADPEVLVGLVLTIALATLLVWGVVRRRPIPVLILGLLLIPLAPYSHVIPFSDVAGERFVYLASAGACLGVGFAVHAALTTGRHKTITLATVALAAAAYTAFTPLRAAQFATTHTLVVATANMVPESYNAQRGLGESWIAQGDPARAIEPYRRAHAIFPDLPTGTLALADALAAAGRIQQAIDLLRSERARLGASAPDSYTTMLRALGDVAP